MTRGALPGAISYPAGCPSTRCRDRERARALPQRPEPRASPARGARRWAGRGGGRGAPRQRPVPRGGRGLSARRGAVLAAALLRARGAGPVRGALSGVSLRRIPAPPQPWSTVCSWSTPRGTSSWRSTGRASSAAPSVTTSLRRRSGPRRRRTCRQWSPLRITTSLASTATRSSSWPSSRVRCRRSSSSSSCTASWTRSRYGRGARAPLLRRGSLGAAALRGRTGGRRQEPLSFAAVGVVLFPITWFSSCVCEDVDRACRRWEFTA